MAKMPRPSLHKQRAQDKEAPLSTFACPLSLSDASEAPDQLDGARHEANQIPRQTVDLDVGIGLAS